MNLVMIEALVNIAKLANSHGYKAKAEQFIEMIGEFTDSGLEETIRSAYENQGRVSAIKAYRISKPTDLKTAMDNVDSMAKSRGWILPDNCYPLR